MNENQTEQSAESESQQRKLTKLVPDHWRTHLQIKLSTRLIGTFCFNSLDSQGI